MFVYLKPESIIFIRIQFLTEISLCISIFVICHQSQNTLRLNTKDFRTLLFELFCLDHCFYSKKYNAFIHKLNDSALKLDKK